MSEFELIEIAAVANEGVRGAGMNFVTIVFAYVVASHLAGSRLSRAATVSISIIYSLWLIGPIISLFGHLDLYYKTANEYLRLFPEGYAGSAPMAFEVILLFAIGPSALGWIGSLIYMHIYIRKDFGGTENKDT